MKKLKLSVFLLVFLQLASTLSANDYEFPNEKRGGVGSVMKMVGVAWLSMSAWTVPCMATTPSTYNSLACIDYLQDTPQFPPLTSSVYKSLEEEYKNLGEYKEAYFCSKAYDKRVSLEGENSNPDDVVMEKVINLIINKILDENKGGNGISPYQPDYELSLDWGYGCLAMDLTSQLVPPLAIPANFCYLAHGTLKFVEGMSPAFTESGFDYKKIRILKVVLGILEVSKGGSSLYENVGKHNIDWEKMGNIGNEVIRSSQILAVQGVKQLKQYAQTPEGQKHILGVIEKVLQQRPM